MALPRLTHEQAKALITDAITAANPLAVAVYVELGKRLFDGMAESLEITAALDDDPDVISDDLIVHLKELSMSSSSEVMLLSADRVWAGEDQTLIEFRFVVNMMKNCALPHSGE